MSEMDVIFTSWRIRSIYCWSIMQKYTLNYSIYTIYTINQKFYPCFAFCIHILNSLKYTYIDSLAVTRINPSSFNLNVAWSVIPSLFNLYLIVEKNDYSGFSCGDPGGRKKRFILASLIAWAILSSLLILLLSSS
jgi:hypothetical protein